MVFIEPGKDHFSSSVCHVIWIYVIRFHEAIVNSSSSIIAEQCYSLRVDNTCYFEQGHNLHREALTTILYYNIYRNINKYMILLKYFFRLIYTYSFHIFNINILVIIYSQRFNLKFNLPLFKTTNIIISPKGVLQKHPSKSLYHCRVI